MSAAERSEELFLSGAPARRAVHPVSEVAVAPGAVAPRAGHTETSNQSHHGSSFRRERCLHPGRQDPIAVSHVRSTCAAETTRPRPPRHHRRRQVATVGGTHVPHVPSSRHSGDSAEAACLPVRCCFADNADSPKIDADDRSLRTPNARIEVSLQCAPAVDPQTTPARKYAVEHASRGRCQPFERHRCSAQLGWEPVSFGGQ